MKRWPGNIMPWLLTTHKDLIKMSTPTITSPFFIQSNGWYNLSKSDMRKLSLTLSTLRNCQYNFSFTISIPTSLLEMKGNIWLSFSRMCNNSRSLKRDSHWIRSTMMLTNIPFCPSPSGSRSTEAKLSAQRISVLHKGLEMWAMDSASLYSRESIITEGLGEQTDGGGGAEGVGGTGGGQGTGADVFHAAGLRRVE